MKFLLIAILVIMGIMAFRAKTFAQRSNYEDINLSKFQELMLNENTVVLDVRTPGEISKGKIENAIEIDYKSSDFSSKVEGLDKESTYLIYCRSGRRSGFACQLMDKLGFEKLYNLKGGYLAWTSENN